MKSLFLFAFFLLTVGACRAAEDICVRHVVVPGYPRLARMARLQGSVTIEVEVGTDGTVTSTKASAASKLLARASEENVRLWTFCAPAATGSLASSHTTITYTYKLEGNEEYYDPPPKVVLDLPSRVEITSHPPEAQPSRTKTLQ